MFSKAKELARYKESSSPSKKTAQLPPDDALDLSLAIGVDDGESSLLAEITEMAGNVVLTFNDRLDASSRAVQVKKNILLS